MSGPAQTPTIFVEAGDAGVIFSPDCVKAIAACGYAPEDFGSYSQVKERIGRAKENTKGSDVAGQAAQVDPNKSPIEHERWVAEGQSGHIAENTRHQATRGDNDTSYCPLYDCNEAPCMPHAGNAFSPKTQHGAVLIQDRQTRKDAKEDPGPSKPLGAEREKDATRKAIAAALDWGTKDEQNIAEVPRDKRFESIAALSMTDAEIAAAKAKGDSGLKEAVKKKQQDNKDVAVDCIEAFVDLQWKTMAEKTKNAKEQTFEKSKADAAAADAKVKQLEGQAKKGENVDKQLAQARKQQQDAHAAHADATKKWDEVKDLKPEKSAECRGQARVKGGGKSKATTTEAEPIGSNEKE
jgi:hypothetical protein